MIQRLWERIFSSRGSLIITTLVGAAFVGSSAILADLLLFGTNERVFLPTLFDSLLTGSVAGALMWAFLTTTAHRRHLVRQRVAEVAELNHQVRNALDVISLRAYLSRHDAPVDEVFQAVDRIQDTLDRLFPAAPPCAAKHSRRSSRAHLATQPKGRVLVLGMSQAVMEARRAVLERSGFDVSVHLAGDAALELLSREPFDAVVLGQAIPEPARSALTAVIKHRWPNIRLVILIPASAELELGGQAFIDEAGFPDTLSAMVHALLAA